MDAEKERAKPMEATKDLRPENPTSPDHWRAWRANAESEFERASRIAEAKGGQTEQPLYDSGAAGTRPDGLHQCDRCGK